MGLEVPEDLGEKGQDDLFESELANDRLNRLRIWHRGRFWGRSGRRPGSVIGIQDAIVKQRVVPNDFNDLLLVKGLPHLLLLCFGKGRNSYKFNSFKMFNHHPHSHAI